MAKPLLTALNKLRQAASNDSKAAKRVHLDYLEAYAEQTKVPLIQDALVFLDFLRNARGALAKEGLSVNQWERDCSHHEGFAKFRSQFLEGKALDKCSSSDLTRIYQNLRRMNPHEDAQQLWPRVAQAMEGRMPRDDLLRVWATCPLEKVPELDLAMSKELRHFRHSWEVLSVLSRTGAMPVQSKTLGICARHAAKMVQENFDISPADMATILYRLHVASQKDTQEHVSSAMRTIKKELVSRSTTFKVGSICKLLPCLDLSSDTELWHLIRGELSEERLETASLSELLDILQFLQERFEGRKSVFGASRRDSGGPEVRSSVTRALTSRLSRGHALPQAVTTVTRRLELIAPFGKICEALLNLAINLRQDLYPAVLWRFFSRTGEVELVKHKNLQPKFHRISEILEEHGVQRDKMTMQEMLKSARAMRVNQVKMPKCVEQMATIFVQNFQNAQRHVGGGAVEADVALEADGVDAGESEAAMDDTPVAGEVEDLKMALEKEDSKFPEVVSMSDTARKSLLSQVEHLVLLFWIELARLEMPNLELSKVALGICQSNTLQMRTIVECLLEMAKVDKFNSEIQMGSQPLRELIQKAISEASDADLLGLIPLGVDVDTAAMVFGEVRQRLIKDKLQLQSHTEVECLMGCLGNLQREDEHFQELIGKAATLVFQQPMENSSEANRQIFAMTSGFLAELPMEDAQQDVLRPLLRPMLQRLLHSEIDSISTPAEDLVHFLFSLTALCGGRLPFDLMSYAWALALKADLAKVASSENMERRAQLLAFSLCARHLSTKTVWTSLRLAPNAESLDSSIFEDQKASRFPRFPLETEKSQEELKQSLRLALSAAVPGEFGEADYQVPGTPFVVDFALQRLQVALVVPGRWHATSGSLKGQGKMMEAVLQAKGWRLLWVWPDAWPSGPNVEELTTALSHAIETPTAVQVVPKSEGIEGAPETLGPSVTGPPMESKLSSFDSAAG